MSKYTTQLRYICESLIGLKQSTEYQSVDAVIQQACPLLFSFDYPIFREEYRRPLEEKIVRHFYLREIGLETVGLFRLKLQEKMQVIMPYYNKFYESELLDFDPLHTVDRWETGNAKRKEVGDRDIVTDQTRNDTVDNSTVNKNLDTPQNNINLLLSENYLTAASTSVLDGSSSSRGNNTTKDNNTVNGEDSYDRHTVGKEGSASFSSLLEEYRKTFLNVDQMVFQELEELFLQLW